LSQEFKDTQNKFFKYETEFENQKEKERTYQNDQRDQFQRATESICTSNFKILSDFVNFEMSAPIRECHDIIKYLWVILRGKDSKEQCDKDFNWDVALEMMTKNGLKKLIDECAIYDPKRMIDQEQWKIAMIYPAIEKYIVDE
jgi:hypothetical protein